MYANSGLLLKTMTEKLLLLFLYVHAPPLSALYCFFWLLYTVSSLTMLKLWCHSHNNRYALGRFESWLVICLRVFPQHREALIYFMLIYYSTWSHWMHSEWNHMASVFNILWILFQNCYFWGSFFSIIIFRQVLWNKHLYFKLFNTLIFFLFWQLSPLMVDSGFKLIKNCLCYYVQCIAIYHHGMVVWFLQQTLNFHSTYELVFMQSFCTYIYPNYGRFYSIPFKWGCFFFA